MADEPVVAEAHDAELARWQQRDAVRRAVRHGVVSGLVGGLFNVSYLQWTRPELAFGVQAIVGFFVVGLVVGLISYRKLRKKQKEGIEPDE